MSEPKWDELRKALSAHLPLEVIKFRVGNAPKDGKPGSALAYIDARVVMDRLDDIVGPNNWTFDFDPIATGPKGEVQSAKGKLTIHGITKCDAGDMAGIEATKSAVSDALKRAAVHWGIGREIYEMPYLKITSDRLTQEDKARFRAIIQRHRANQDTEDDTPAPSQAQSQPRQQAAKPAPAPQRGPQTPPHLARPVDDDSSFERVAKPRKPGELTARARAVGYTWPALQCGALGVEPVDLPKQLTIPQQEKILAFLEAQEKAAREASLRTSNSPLMGMPS